MPFTKKKYIRQVYSLAQALIQGGSAGAGAHPRDGRTCAQGAGSLVSRAERRDTGVS